MKMVLKLNIHGRSDLANLLMQLSAQVEELGRNTERPFQIQEQGVAVGSAQFSETVLSPYQLAVLTTLEKAVYDAGVDGGETTSAAIDDLRNKEVEYFVYDPTAATPRWQPV